jgi:hypothetical protein
MKWLLVAAFLVAAGLKRLHAQQSIFTINPGEQIQEVVPDSACYTYPAFKNGIVLFKDNRRVPGRFNYNALFEELMFISPAGDTLALDNGALIQYVAVESDTFYFAHSFLKNAGSFGDIRLAGKELFAIVDVNAIGAMGTKAASSVTTVRTWLTRGESAKLTLQEIMKIRKETQFYLGDKFNNYKLINRKNLLDFFPGKSKKIKEYLKDQPVNFQVKDDVVRMLSYLGSA